jgi:2-polyprenyl-3-methyl-5-hydroxy-6-metoxy-1,4-benzoquinol methylase
MGSESKHWHDVYKDSALVARRTSSHRRKLQRLGILDLPRDARILDVACGTGEALRILHDEGFTNLSGTDISEDPDLAREPWLTLRTSDAKSISFDTDSFDAVICMHSLHHMGGLEGIRATVHECLRVLRPNGLLALIDHYDSMQLRTAFWGIQKPWLTWPTRGLRAFREQHVEEWPYMYEYLDAWPGLTAMLASLPCSNQALEKGAFFFYWTARKLAAPRKP